VTPPERRPFRFGVGIPGSIGDHGEVLEIARRAEAAGASVLVAFDHLGAWGAMPRLVAAAQATSLRIGPLVLNNDLRHPTVLAQELATVDAMTDGRLEIGLGAGWNRTEYEAAGLRFDPPAQRLRRMRASLAMLRQALSAGIIDHDADDAYPAIHQAGLPTSVQRPHPPFLVGGGGPKLLAFAAREAQIVGLDPRSLPGGGSDPEDITADAIERKVGWIREAAGDRWAELELTRRSCRRARTTSWATPSRWWRRCSPVASAGASATSPSALITSPSWSPSWRAWREEEGVRPEPGSGRRAAGAARDRRPRAGAVPGWPRRGRLRGTTRRAPGDDRGSQARGP
jgi:probable F420-dependent oxidoreductase